MNWWFLQVVLKLAFSSQPFFSIDWFVSSKCITLCYPYVVKGVLMVASPACSWAVPNCTKQTVCIVCVPRLERKTPRMDLTDADRFWQSPSLSFTCFISFGLECDEGQWPKQTTARRIRRSPTLGSWSGWSDVPFICIATQVQNNASCTYDRSRWCAHTMGIWNVSFFAAWVSSQCCRSLAIIQKQDHILNFQKWWSEGHGNEVAASHALLHIARTSKCHVLCFFFIWKRCLLSLFCDLSAFRTLVNHEKVDPDVLAATWRHAFHRYFRGLEIMVLRKLRALSLETWDYLRHLETSKSAHFFQEVISAGAAYHTCLGKVLRDLDCRKLLA